jgi:hypothetical protein
MRKSIAFYTRQEKSILLYAETCLVDNYGRLNQTRMNTEDFENLDKMKAEKLLDYGRLPSKEIEESMKTLGRFQTSTHWVSFTEQAFKLVTEMRRERAYNGTIKLREIMEKHHAEM